jgi:hypothetical protein
MPWKRTPTLHFHFTKQKELAVSPAFDPFSLHNQFSELAMPTTSRTANGADRHHPGQN